MGFGTGDAMKLLLTSGGITNATIKNGLQRLLGKPISEATALIIPTLNGATRTAVRTRSRD